MQSSETMGELYFHVFKTIAGSPMQVLPPGDLITFSTYWFAALIHVWEKKYGEGKHMWTPLAEGQVHWCNHWEDFARDYNNNDRESWIKM